MSSGIPFADGQFVGKDGRGKVGEATRAESELHDLADFASIMTDKF